MAHVLEPLSGRERLIVELHTVVGLSFEEIGALQGISKSEAQRIHKSGLARLDRARKNWCLPPFPISTDRPSPDALGRAWARVVAEGLADVPTAPPASGPRLSPSSRPSVALGSVAPYAGRGFLRLIICSFICGLSFCGDVVGKFGPHSRAASAAPVSAPSAPPARAQMSGASVASGEPEVTRRSPPPPVPVSSLPDAESPLASASARPPPTRHDLERDLLAERVLVDQARVLLRQNPRAAIAAVLEARDLFPHGRSAAAREETFKKACAKIGAHEPLPPACLRP